MEKQIWQAEIIISAAFSLLLLVRCALCVSGGAPIAVAAAASVRRVPLPGQSQSAEHKKEQRIRTSDSTYLHCGLWSTRALTQLGTGTGSGTE